MNCTISSCSNGLPISYLSQLPPKPLYQYFCRVCMKSYRDSLAAKRHENDYHGPRMKYGRCKFSCPGSRPGEMRKHLKLKHDMATGPPPRERRRQSTTTSVPTERIPAQTLAVESYTLSSNQDGFFSSLGTIDLGPEPDLTIGEPVSYTPTYGPTFCC